MAELMTVTETAEYLGKTPAALRWQMHSTGDVPPYIKIGGRIAFRRTLIDKWLDEKFAEAMKENA